MWISGFNRMSSHFWAELLLSLLILVELYLISSYYPTHFPAYILTVLLLLTLTIIYTLTAIFRCPSLPLKAVDQQTDQAVARLIESREYKDYEARKGRPSYGYRVSEGVAGELNEKEMEIYQEDDCA